jgi:TRAP-type C4-dicarboxylate transport system permease large subunit
MLFVIFGVLAQISIGDMFIAGIVPGLLMAFAFVCVIALLGYRYNYPPGERLTSQAEAAATSGPPFHRCWCRSS